MARWTRRGVGGCVGVCLLALALVPTASADPNVIPIAGGGSGLGDGGPATAGTLAQPLATAVLHDYDYYYRDYLIADYDHCRVRQVGFGYANAASDVGDLTTVVGTGACGNNDLNNVAGTSYQLDHPSSVSATPERQVLIADSGNGRVLRWSPTLINGQAANTVQTLAGTKVPFDQTCAASSPADLETDASAARFCSLWRVAAHPWYYGASGPAYFPDSRFLVIDGGCTANQFPCGASAIAPHIYVVHLVSGVWKVKAVAVGCGDAAAQPVCFTDPSGVTFTGSDPDDFLVTDRGKNEVQRYSVADPAVATVVAGTGQSTDATHPLGDDGAPTAATFSSPSDVVMTNDGGYYVADTYNCLVRKVSELGPQAMIYSIGGTCGDGQPDHTTVPSGQADLWPTGLNLGPAGLYVSDFVTNQVKLFDRTTITSGPPPFTNSTRATFKVQSLDGYGKFVCNWTTVDTTGERRCVGNDGTTALESDGTAFQIPPASQPALGEGPQLFYACAAPIPDPAPPLNRTPMCNYGDNFDRLADPTPARWNWTIDVTAPQGLALGEPADGASGVAPSPTFTWHAADGGPSGVDHYELWIDGKKNRDVATSACSAGTCSTAATAALSEAGHKWQVRATDGAGNGAQTAERSFASGSPPAAAFKIAPNPVLAGRPVTFDGSTSVDASGPIARYEWDLDGDGTFETDTGATATASKTYTNAGQVTIQLRVTDGAGLTNVASAVLTVSTETIAGQLGVTVNNGAQYTNSPNVKLNVVAPATVTRLLVANDGGFLAATPFTPAKELTWKLDSSGPERLPKTVYVRFVSGPVTSPNYTDDIILDERPPVVQQATLNPGPGAASIARMRSWNVKIKATDSNSGVGFVQVSANKKKPGKLIAYKRKLTVKLAVRPRFVRARDRAGNFSPWKKLR